MAEHSGRSDLERDLRGLGNRIAFPAAATMATAVGRELKTDSTRIASRRVTWPRRRLIAVTVAVGLLLVAATAGAARLVIGAIAVKVVPGSGISGTPEIGPNLGSAMSLSEAESAAGFQILVPSGLSEPDAVFVDGGRASLVWRAGSDLPRIPGTPWGIVLVEFRGIDVQAVKEAPQGTSIESVRVGSSPGFFIAGPTDLVLQGGKRLGVPGGVVLWQRGPITLRLESLLSKTDAVRLASTIS